MKKVFFLFSFLVFVPAVSVTAVSGQVTNDQLDMLLSNCLDPDLSFSMEKTTYCIAIIDTIDRLCQNEFFPVCLDSRYWVGTEQ